MAVEYKSVSTFKLADTLRSMGVLYRAMNKDEIAIKYCERAIQALE